MKVLIVDDHQVVRRGVRSLLEAESGFEICGEAVDGRDAITKAQQLHPDAIVMDISMPNLNGLEATREIRRVLPAVKIVILSQHNIPEMMRQARSVGAHGYVVKSALFNELAATLARVQKADSFIQEEGGPSVSNVDLQEILQRSLVFERALRESEERLRLAQQVARVGTFEYNLKTGLNRWTPEMETLYGIKRGTFPGTQAAWELLIHPEDRDTTIAALSMAASEGGFEGEWRVLWPDGSVRWLLGRAWLFRDSAGQPERWVGAHIDITDRKRSQQRAEREAQLLNLSFDAIVVPDTGDCVRYWNHGAEDLYGWTAQEVLGQVTHTLLQTVFPQPLEDIFTILRGEGRWEGELSHLRKDGSRVAVMSRWALFRDLESDTQWVLETNTDITKQKATEEDLKKAIHMLEQQLGKKARELARTEEIKTGKAASGHAS